LIKYNKIPIQWKFSAHPQSVFPFVPVFPGQQRHEATWGSEAYYSLAQFRGLSLLPKIQ
jgi:hypothetical protein